MGTAAAAPTQNLARGVAFVLAAFFFAAVMSTLSKAARDVPPLVTLTLQYAISLLVFLPSALRAPSGFFRTQHLPLHAFRSLSGSVCQLLFFIAVKSIPLLDAVLLTNAAPLFIPLVVFVWLGKAVQPLVWVSLVVGLIGIVLIIKPGPQMFHNPASLFALLGGFCSAVALVATNKLAESEPPTRILVYNFGISTVLLVPLCVWAWKPLPSKAWLLLVGIGLTYAATQYLIILAYRQASAASISPFNYSVVVFSGILGWIFFGNVPDRSAVLGTVLICAGGILSTRAGHTEGLGHGFGSGHWRLQWRHRRDALPAHPQLN